MSASAGRVLLIPKGDYNSETAYSVLDWVRYQGAAYVCKQASTGNLPTNTTYWQLMTQDGGGTDENAYHTTDTAETTIDDADYVPFYDTSASAARKSLWSNVKSVLKTYFDTLYSKGHTILDNSGTSMTQRAGLQFSGMSVTDDSGNDKTVVTPLTPDYVDAPYNSTTTYSKGMTCISGNKRYRYINSSATAGNTPPNATYWEEESLASQANGICNYSTTETKIGLWVDGKILYRKVYEFDVTENDLTVVGNQKSWVSSTLGLSSYSYSIKDIKVTVLRLSTSDKDITYPSSYFISDADMLVHFYNRNTDKLGMRFGSTGPVRPCKVTAVFEYTK